MAPTEIERHNSSFADEKKLSHEHLEHHDDPETLKPVNGVESKKKGANTQLDDAARLLQEAGGSVEYTPEENKRVLRMIDLYVCVPVRTTSISSKQSPKADEVNHLWIDVHRLLDPTTRQILRLLRSGVRPPSRDEPQRDPILLAYFRRLPRSIDMPTSQFIRSDRLPRKVLGHGQFHRLEYRYGMYGSGHELYRPLDL